MSRETSDREMGATSELMIDADVACTDGDCGELKRVVIDPIQRELTHLVVEPPHRHGNGRLVPVALVDATTTGRITLRCTLTEFHALEEAEETQFMPGASGQWGYGQSQMLSWPYYGLGMGGAAGLGMSAPQPVVMDRVPPGEVEVRRGEHVHATDGPIGRVRGLVIDPADHDVTHVLLDHGHLWGQRHVAIPISAVLSVDDGVRLSLNKDQIRDLPPVELDHDAVGAP